MVRTAGALPRAAAKRTAVVIASNGTRLRANINPNLTGKKSWKVQILRDSGGQWRHLRTVKTKGRAEKVNVALPAGRYLVKVSPKKGYNTARASAIVRITPAPAPKAPASRSGFPNASNTGVPAGITLTRYTGPCTITANGTVIDAKVVSCDLRIRARNVRVTRSRINGSINSYGLTSGYSFQISDSEVRIGDRPGTGIGEVNFTATRVEVTGGNRSINCYLNCTVADSYLHGQFTDRTGRYHEGAVRMGQNATIRHNTLVCDAPDIPPDAGCSAGLSGYGDFDPVRNNLIEGNLFKATPGSFCAYGGSTPNKPYSNGAHHIVFRNNIFERGPSGRCGTAGPILHFNSSLPGNVWSGNKWSDGKPVKPHNR